MFRRLFPTVILTLTAALPARAETSYDQIDEPPHNYTLSTPQDRFTRLKDDLESGRVPLDYSGEKPFLLSLLKTLDISPNSQMLVFSTTSLQLSLITPANPRALFFNEETYVGFIPGGRIEIVSLDPALGAIFYIFDIPKPGQLPRPDRSGRCMNCHAGDDTGRIPGLVIKSVVPGPTGGSLTAYRIEKTGHTIPLSDRFGGWYLTGAGTFTNHWGNLTGRLSDGELTRVPVEPGTRFSYDRYPVASSDLLPHLLHEHQAGFVNRIVQATYRARTIMYLSHGKPTPAQEKELEEQAALVTRYLLFADEARLPPGGVAGNAGYKNDFLHNRRATPDGLSLKDFDLKTRLFKYRCSYMIYSPVFDGMPPVIKQRIYRHLGNALSEKDADPDYTYIPASEKKAIRSILRQTLADLPESW